MKVKLKVKRTNTDDGPAGDYSTYEIDAADNVTLLDALIQVREYEDGTLALRCSCRSAICGSCAMRVDGRARLACRAKVIALTRGDENHEITVEPMGNMPVIKDLVTDMEIFWSKIRQVDPFIEPAQDPPSRRPSTACRTQSMIDLTHTMNCIMCGACVSDCTVLEVDKNFIAPAALAKAYRVAADPRDGHAARAPEKLQRVRRHLGLHALQHVRRGLPEGRRADEPHPPVAGDGDRGGHQEQLRRAPHEHLHEVDRRRRPAERGLDGPRLRRHVQRPAPDCRTCPAR